jgi:2-polyprenyl-6-methoxyphenol hydroxylase-like FAD-dependent oxidoreductase
VIDFPELPYGNLGLPQFATERILTEHLTRFGIAVERGVTLSDLRDKRRAVEVELMREDGRLEQAEFRYVIGCDGARLTRPRVRHRTGNQQMGATQWIRAG